MIESKIIGRTWTLDIDGERFLSHTPEHPAVTMVRIETSYTADRGTVTKETKETERIPLREITAKDPYRLRFFGIGHDLEVRIREIEGGAELYLFGEDGFSYEFSVYAEPDEAVFGGGEQYRKTNLRGEKVVNFVSEHIKASTIVEKTFVPKSRYREKTHSEIGSYSPIPLFVTDRGRVFSIRTRSDGMSDFTGETEYRFSFDTCPQTIALLKGNDYRSIAELLAKRVRNHQYIPDWCLDGMILGAQGGREVVLEKTFSLLDAGAKISAVWSQDWSGENRTVMGKQVWWNWEADEKLYPDLPGMIRELRDRGVRFLGYINPYLVKGSRLYEQCRNRGFLIRKRDGSIYHIRSTTFDAGMLDLTNPSVVRFIKEELIGKNMLGIGMFGWMADFGEYLPVDCVLYDGDPAKLHNGWPVLWARINREAIEEYCELHEEAGKPENILFFTRSGYMRVQRYASVMWNGDQHTDFTKDYGMPSVMPATFSLGFSGITMVHCDIGGFFSFGKMVRTDEIFIRWMEMCAFSLMMRSHESLRPWVNSQPFFKTVVPFTVMLTNVHAKLKPYLKHCIEEAKKGIPVIRPDFYEEMSYSESHEPYAYFLGDDLFVAPVTEEGSEIRTIFLPKGNWVHFWTGQKFKGGDTCMVGAPYGQIPVFYREETEYADIFKDAAKERAVMLRDYSDISDKAANVFKAIRERRERQRS